MFNKPEILPDDIDKFLRKHGRNGVKTLSLLGKSSEFYAAFNSDIGREIMKDVMVRMESLLIRIVEITATDEEKIEYKILLGLFNGWNNKIATHVDAAKKIKEG